MKYDYSKLKGRIIEKYDTYKAFADALGISPQYLSAKLNGSIDITKSDIEEWSRLLSIPMSEVGIYFFRHKSQECKEGSN